MYDNQQSYLFVLRHIQGWRVAKRTEIHLLGGGLSRLQGQFYRRRCLFSTESRTFDKDFGARVLGGGPRKH